MSDNEKGLRKVNDVEYSINIDGYLVPFSDDQPICFAIDGVAEGFIMVFEDIAAMRRMAADFDFGLDEVDLKKVDNGVEFLESVMGTVRVALNPYKHENGKLRFVEIIRSRPKIKA